MKKLIKLLGIVLVILLVSGCGSKEEKDLGSLAYECTQKRTDTSGKYERQTTYKIYSKDGKNVSFSEINDVLTGDSDTLEVIEKSEKASYDAINETYGGYEIKTSLNDDELNIDVKIDYNKFNVKAYGEDVEAMKKYVSDDKISIEGLQKLYVSYGAKCTKKES